MYSWPPCTSVEQKFKVSVTQCDLEAAMKKKADPWAPTSKLWDRSKWENESILVIDRLQGMGGNISYEIADREWILQGEWQWEWYSVWGITVQVCLCSRWGLGATRMGVVEVCSLGTDWEKGSVPPRQKGNYPQLPWSGLPFSKPSNDVLFLWG